MKNADNPPEPSAPTPPVVPPDLPSHPSLRVILSPPATPAAELRRRLSTLVRFGIGDRQQVAMQMLGRVLLHAALVGAAAGLVGSLFVAGLEVTQIFVLEHLAGYLPLRAEGEEIVSTQTIMTFRPWLLWCIPALGALVAGAISARFAPETRGGGSDAVIEAFHQHDGVVRRRVRS